jgi:hypothetical protein
MDLIAAAFARLEHAESLADIQYLDARGSGICAEERAWDRPLADQVWETCAVERAADLAGWTLRQELAVAEADVDAGLNESPLTWHGPWPAYEQDHYWTREPEARHMSRAAGVQTIWPTSRPPGMVAGAAGQGLTGRHSLSSRSLPAVTWRMP